MLVIAASLASALPPAPETSAPEALAPEMVVTGRGLDDAPGEAVYDIVTIDRARLSLSPSNRLEDVLRDVPGFQLFRRSDARSANPTSQGATLRALGGNASSRILLTLDGVPQTDPFGGWISWPAYDPRRLGRARVVRGGGSGAAGPGALAGTIELDSTGPRDGDRLTASLAYGSRSSLDAFAAASVPLGQGQLSLTASHAEGDGFVPIVAGQRGPVDRPAPYAQSSASVRAIAPLGAAVELQANLLAFRDERERGTAFSAIATDGFDASLRLVGSGRWSWSALGYVQTRSFANSFASVSGDRATVTRASDQYHVPSTGSGARIELRPPLGPVSLRLGADLRAVSGDTREFYSYVAAAPTRGRRAGGESRTLGAFAEAAWEHGPLTLTAAGRIDCWWITDGYLREEILATLAPVTDLAFADRSGWEPTARGGVAWELAPAVTARAAAYLGWRLPTLNELYRPFRTGADATAANADLAPETLRGAELGLEWRPTEGARIGITAFASRLDGAIANVTLGTGPGTFPGVGFVGAGGAYRQRRNLDAVESQGLEVDAALRRGPWSLTAGYSYADARVAASGPAAPLDGLRPAQTPRHSASATVAWQAGGHAASLSVRYVGAQYEDDLNQLELPGALTFDAAARFAITGNIFVEARAENIGDERVVAGISGNGLIERATPRTLWIGLRFSR